MQTASDTLTVPAPETERESSPLPAMKIGLYVFLASFAIHLLFLLQFAQSPFFWVPRLDALFHDVMARQILSGELPAEPFFRAPAYGYFLAALYGLFGVQNYWAVRLAHAVIASVSVVLLFQLGERVFDRRTGLLAAVTMLFYGPLLFLQHDLHTSVLEVVFTLSFLLFLLRSRDRPDRLQESVLAGLFLGLAAVTRPNALIGLPVGWFSLTRTRNALLPFTLAALFFPILVTVRNVVVGHDPVFIASQGGINLFLGNRPGADGFTPSTPTRYRVQGEYEDSVALYGRKAAEEALGRQLKPSEVNRYWIAEAAGFWRNSPGAALQLTARKTLLALTHQEIRNNTAYSYMRAEWTPFLFVTFLGFGYAAPFGLLGMLLAWRTHPEARPLSVFVVLYVFSFIAFFVADRFRLPVVPILLLFASHSIWWLLGPAWKQPFPRTVFPLTVLFGLLAVSWIPWIPTATPATHAQDIWSAGNRLNALGRHAEAEAQMRKALTLYPDNYEFWSGLGESLYYQKKFSAAIEAFQQAIVRSPGDAALLFNVALCYQEMGQSETARKTLQEVLRRDSGYEPAQKLLQELSP